MYTHDRHKRRPEPPLGLTRVSERQFFMLPFKMQIFIYLKYVLQRDKRGIMKYMFIATDHTYYDHEKKAKQIIQALYNPAS